MANPLLGIPAAPLPKPSPAPGPKTNPLLGIPAAPLERRGFSLGTSFKEGVQDIGRIGLAPLALGEQLSKWALEGGGANVPDEGTPFSNTLRDMALSGAATRQAEAEGYAAPSLPTMVGEGIVRSGTAMVPGIALAPAVAAAGASPLMINAVTAAPGAISTAGNSIGEDLNDPNMGSGRVIGRSLLQGGLELGGELIPLGKLGRGPEEALARMLAGERGAALTVAKGASEVAAGGGQEALTSGAQSIASDVTGTKPVTVGEVASNAGESALMGLLTGAPMAAGMTAVHGGVNAVRDHGEQNALDAELNQAQPGDDVLRQLALQGLDPAQATNGNLPAPTEADAPLAISPEVIDAVKNVPGILEMFGLKGTADRTNQTEELRRAIEAGAPNQRLADEENAPADPGEPSPSDVQGESQAPRARIDALRNTEHVQQAGREPALAQLQAEEEDALRTSQQIAEQEANAEQEKIRKIQAEALAAEKAQRDDMALRERAYDDLNRLRPPDDQVDRAHFGLPPKPVEPPAQPITLGRPKEPTPPAPAAAPDPLEAARRGAEDRLAALHAEEADAAGVTEGATKAPVKKPITTAAKTAPTEPAAPVQSKEVTNGQEIQRQTQAPSLLTPEPAPMVKTTAPGPVSQEQNAPSRPVQSSYPRPTSVPVRSIADLDRGFREVYGLKPEESATALALVRARASELGEDADAFAARTIAEVRRGKGKTGDDALLQEGTRIIPRDQSLEFPKLQRQWKKAHGDRELVPGSETWNQLKERARAIDEANGILYQEDVANLYDAPKDAGTGKKTQHAAISFMQDGRAVLHALNAPNASSAFHELAHMIRRTLSPVQMAVAGRWAGAKDGKWSRSAEEKFARGFERYLRDGTTPNKALQKIFGKMRDWLRTIYQSIKGSPIDIPITPEIRALFDQMLTPKDQAQAAKLAEGIASDEQRAANTPAAAPGAQTVTAPSPQEAAPAPSKPDSVAPSSTASVPSAPEIVPSEPQKGTNQGTTNEQVEDKTPAREKSSTQVPDVGRTSAEQKDAAAQSRPELANPATETPVRKLVREAREKMVDPERKAQEQSTADGKALLGDPAKTAALRAKVKAGEPLSDVETAAFRELLDREGASAIAEGGDKLKQTIEAIQGYTRGGTEQARALAMRRDRNQTPEDRRKSALIQAVLMPSQRMEGQLNSVREKLAKASPSEKPALQKQIDQMTAQEVARVEKFKKRMAGLGFDLDQMDMLYQSDEKTAAIVDEARIDKADKWDAAYEWWMCSILSGVKTNVTNTVGNVGNFLSNYGWEKPITGILGKIPGLRKAGPSLGELGAVYQALFSKDAWAFAARHFTDTWSAERPMLDAEMASGRFLTRAQARMTSDSGGQFNAHAPVNRNVVAKALRSVSLRAIQSVDQFFKGLGARAEVAGRAYRLASESGYTPGTPEHAEFMAQEIGDIESRSWAHAYEEAKRLTFNQNPGPITQGVVNLRKTMAGTRYIVPFIPILVNLIGRGLKLAPVTSQLNQAQRIVRQGLWAAKPGMRGALPYTKSEFIQDLAAGTVGLMALGIMGSWADDDKDGLPNLTGTEARYIPAKDQTVPPKSIRLFGKYWDYSRLSPFDSVMATVADFHNARKHKADAISTAISNIQYQVLDKSFMSTVNDVTKAIAAGEGGTNTVARFVRGVLVGFVPNVIRQPLGASQDDTKDQKAYAQPSLANPSWWLEQGRLAVGSAMGGLPFVPKVDLWGQEQSQGKKAPTEKLGSDFLWRALAPMAGSDGKASNVYEQAIYNWNKTAEKPQWPGYPRNYITRPDGSRWYYTSETYNTMLKERGKLVMEYLKGWEPKDPIHPTADDIDYIHDAFRDATTRAQESYREKAKAGPDTSDLP